VEFEARGFQRGASIVCEGTPHSRTVAPHDFGFRVAPSFEAPFDGTYPTDTLFQFFLGMAIGFINGLRRFTEIMEVTKLVWHSREHLRDGTADGKLAVRNDTDNRHLYGLPHRPEQFCQVRVGC